MSTASEIADYLQTQLSIATVYVDFLPPEEPHVALAVFAYAGAPSVGGFGVAGIAFEYPGIQIQARGARDDHDAPELLCNQAWRKVAEIQGMTLGSTYYLMARSVQSPAKLLTDDKGRHVFAASFNVEKRP